MNRNIDWEDIPFVQIIADFYSILTMVKIATKFAWVFDRVGAKSTNIHITYVQKKLYIEFFIEFYLDEVWSEISAFRDISTACVGWKSRTQNLRGATALPCALGQKLIFSSHGFFLFYALILDLNNRNNCNPLGKNIRKSKVILIK